MKKVLLTVTSGVLIALVSSNAIAITEHELELGMAAKAGLTERQAHNALAAFELKIKEEILLKHRVTLDNFGRYNPRESHLTAEQLASPGISNTNKKFSWYTIKNPSGSLTQSDLVSSMAAKNGMSISDNNRLIEAYKATLRESGQKNMDAFSAFPKYADPVTGNTWSGHGKAPTWLAAKLAAGASIDQYRTSHLFPDRGSAGTFHYSFTKIKSK
jgi:H-NS histone family